jgi:hypothetical protein
VFAGAAAALVLPIEIGSLKFESRTAASKVVENAGAIVNILGPPAATVPDRNGSVDLVYIGGSGDRCRIEFANGVAVRVVRWTK